MSSTIDISKTGHRYGHLEIAYALDRGRHIVAYCVCSKQVHVSWADLASGLVNSCGCQPPTPKFWGRYAQLRSQLNREIGFSIAKAR